eukprot:1624952-Amphidinium_carterae.3
METQPTHQKLAEWCYAFLCLLEALKWTWFQKAARPGLQRLKSNRDTQRNLTKQCAQTLLRDKLSNARCYCSMGKQKSHMRFSEDPHAHTKDRNILHMRRLHYTTALSSTSYCMTYTCSSTE